MSKKLYFLMCFVLVLTLSGAAQAVPIDDPNYNLSFEYHWPDVCGVVSQIYGHTGIDATPPTPDPCEPNKGVRNWLSTGSGFQGVDVFCPYAYDSPTHCHQWPGSDDPYGIAYIYLQHSGNGIHQILDGNDANAVITAGRQYTMTVDALDAGTAGVGLRFYSASGLIAEELYPDLPEILQPIENCDSGENELEDLCVDWHRDLTVSFMCLGGEPYENETLELEVVANGGGGQYAFMDNVRLEWMWLFNAYYPYPEDKAEDVPKVVTLHWTPGLWAQDANAHEVYFGTDKAAVEAATTATTGIYRGLQDRDVNSYSPSELPLELGKTYYWRIDEVNEAYAGPPAAAPDANGRWKGDIWSFEVTGFATNPDPEDEAEEVSLYTDLSWTPGTDSNSHDVYFGTGEAAVDDANRSSSEYMGNQDANDFNDFVPALELGKTYYWRIDEVNETAGTLIKGKLWSFTVATYFRVDDMDSYVDDAAMRAVWKDYSSGSLWGKNGAEVFVETSPDNVISGNSMRYYFRNINTQAGVGYVGSEAMANTSDLESGSNWSKGGVKAWALSFYGDATNLTDTSGVVGGIHQDQMYVAVEDGDDPCGIGIVKWPDMDDIREASWHEWNIEMADPCLADVNMANIAKVYIGFGGQKVGQTERGAGNVNLAGDTVWFDDIRLYPPRCVPEYAHLTGSFRYINRYEEKGELLADCKNDYFDVWAMGSDWLVSSYGNVTASEPCDANLVGHWAMDDDAKNSNVVDSSTYARHGTLYNNLKMKPPPPTIQTGKTDAHHTDDCAEGTGALEFDGIDDFISLPALFDANTNTVTISAWIKTDAIDEVTFMPTIVGCNDVCNPPRLTLGQTGAYAPLEYWSNNDLAYYWTGWSWDLHPELILPTKLWSFVALVVEPTKGTLYLSVDGGKLYASTNHEAHEPKSLAKGNNAFIAGWFDYKKRVLSGAEFKGAIDDVRVYDYSLSPGEIMYLAFQGSGSQYLALEPWRADANNDDKVNLKDYVIMARNWLKEVLWPFE